MNKVNQYNDEINYKKFFKLILKRKFLIIGFTFLVVISVLGFELYGKKDKKFKGSYEGKVLFEIGYITFIPNSSNNLNMPKELQEQLFLRKQNIDNVQTLSEIIQHMFPMVKASFNYNQYNKDSNMLKVTYTDLDEEKVKNLLNQVSIFILKRQENILKEFHKSELTLVPSKQVGKTNIKYIASKTSLKMKLIVSFVMGLIISVILGIFLERLEENKGHN